MARKTSKSAKYARRSTIGDQEVAIPGIGDLSPAQRVWAVTALLPRADRPVVLGVCEKLGVKRNVAAAQFQLARYGQHMRRVAADLPERAKVAVKRTAEVVAEQTAAAD